MRTQRPIMENMQDMAKKMREDIIQEIAAAGSGHPGGSLSVTDILAELYFHKMKIDPQNPEWEDRDRLVLSKGHVAPALYKLDHVITLLDFNGLQIDGTNEEVMNINPVDEKFRAFGWDVQVIDSHGCSAIGNAVDAAKQTEGKPSIIVIANKEKLGSVATFRACDLSSIDILVTNETDESVLSAYRENGIQVVSREVSP